MPLIQFPDVPDVPGVPALIRNLAAPVVNAVLSPLGSAVVDAALTRPVWGIFDQNGAKVLNPDSFLGIDFHQDTRVSTYPQEQGAFASYNKVGTPYDCRIRMAVGSDETARTAFLATCDGMLNSTDLFSVVTPEVTSPRATLKSYDYRRTDKNGVSMLTVELDFIEVRITATADFSQIDEPQEPSAADPVSDGQVQATPVTQSTVTAVDLPPLQTGGVTGSW